MSEAINSGAALVSGGISAGGSDRARKKGIVARQKANAEIGKGTKDAKKQLTKGYNETSRIFQPYMSGGISAFNDAQANAANFQFDPSQIINNPAYNFRRDQGIEAVNRSMAAGGFLNSGNRALGIMDYAQGLASTEYENEYRRQYGEFADNFTRRMGIAGMGLHAGERQAQNVGNYRAGIADLIMNRANASAGYLTEAGDINAATSLAKAQNWAATNMYMGNQAASGFENYLGGGSKKSGGGG